MGEDTRGGVQFLPIPLLTFQDPSPGQGEGKRAWRARVRVIVSRARGAHVACAFRARRPNRCQKRNFQAIRCVTLTASRRVRPPFPVPGVGSNSRGRVAQSSLPIELLLLPSCKTPLPAIIRGCARALNLPLERLRPDHSNIPGGVTQWRQSGSEFSTTSNVRRFLSN